MSKYLHQCQTGLRESLAGYWFNQVTSALTALHDKGLAHRDIKPGNILLDRNMRALLGDYGFVTNGGEDNLATTWCGTRPYKSPEILKHEPYDAFKADSWGR